MLAEMKRENTLADRLEFRARKGRSGSSRIRVIASCDYRPDSKLPSRRDKRRILFAEKRHHAEKQHGYGAVRHLGTIEAKMMAQ